MNFALQTLRKNSRHIEKAKELFESSFPPEERPDFASLFTRSSKHYRKKIIVDRANKLIGILFYWDFRQFYFIEHLAISDTERGKGIGSELILYLKNFAKKNILLEIEVPIDELSTKRKLFYERGGFAVNPFYYEQAPYFEEGRWIEMKLLSLELLNEKTFKKRVRAIYRHVYNCRKLE